MKKFDAVLYMLPVANGEFENVVNPNTHAIIHRNPKYDHVPVYAIVLDIHEQENEDPLLDLAFLHPSQAGALAGADWREAFERAFAVRHADHDDVGDNFAMGHYRELPGEQYERFAKDLSKAYDEQTNENRFLREEYARLQTELANTTEAKDKALQAIADAGARQPSAADLDAVAEEQKAKEQTS